MADYGTGRTNIEFLARQTVYESPKEGGAQCTSELVRQRRTNEERSWTYHSHLDVCLVSRTEATKTTCPSILSQAAASGDFINDTNKNRWQKVWPDNKEVRTKAT